MKIGRRKRCGKCRSCGKTKRRFSHSSLDLRSTLPTTPAAAVLPQTQLSFYSPTLQSGSTTTKHDIGGNADGVVNAEELAELIKKRQGETSIGPQPDGNSGKLPQQKPQDAQ